MSGLPGSSDIEDVVSSVRRLVSADGRASPDMVKNPLVLTPALRIAHEGEADDLIDPVPVGEPTVPSPAAPSGADPLAEPWAQTEVVPDPVPAGETTASAVDLAEPSADRPQPLQLVAEEWEDEIWTEDDPSLAELALGAEEAQLVAAEPPPATAAEADGIRQPLVPAEPADPAADRTGLAGYASDQVVSFDSHRARAPSAEAKAAEPLELTDPDGNPLTILDEEALQEIVRQLIREELQGSLGERITRNVRKLVRAEINRALTARSLD